MQVSIPCIAFANSRTEITYKGGTNAEMAPSIDYYMEVVLCLSFTFCCFCESLSVFNERVIQRLLRVNFLYLPIVEKSNI